MKKRNSEKLMLLMLTLVLAFGFAIADMQPAFADHAADARQLVEKSKMTLDTFVTKKDLGSFRDLLSKAKGVFISPQMLEGAFIFGASGGSGVLVTRDAKSGFWNGPAFYTIGEASFGFQAGGQASQVVMLAMTDRGVTALLAPSVKLGADIGVAAGPVGVGASAATANISADIITYSLSKGLYGGISLEGAVVAVRKEWNGAYYKKPGVTPTDILVRKEVNNPHSANLVQTVARAAGGKPTTEMKGRYHTVERGDTLYRISQKYGVSVPELRRLNNIGEGQYIYPGQKILIEPSN
jgi:lipid-binding SYLF domain-containing protein